VKFSDLVGKTLSSVSGAVGEEEILFHDTEGHGFHLYHLMDCCETVEVQDICGELQDLVGSPIVMAEESTSDEHPKECPAPKGCEDSFTWTFYRIATAKGTVAIRWLGRSNGYYSEKVSFDEL
jgi:hypothetical protein